MQWQSFNKMLKDKTKLKRDKTKLKCIGERCTHLSDVIKTAWYQSNDDE